MAYKGQRVLALVPARGGSKSIPRKNLCCVAGHSLVGRASALAAGLDFVDRAICSTDDDAIAAEARQFGVDVPFMRPAELAEDRTSSADMWRQAWLESESLYGEQFDVSVLLEPTSPMRRAEDVTRALDALLSRDGNLAAATVSRTPAHFTPNKTLLVDDAGFIGFYLADGARYSTRQNIKREYYHKNGLCYAVRRETVVERRQIVEERCQAVVVERPTVNIDEPFDLELAEFLLARESNRGSS